MGDISVNSTSNINAHVTKIRSGAIVHPISTSNAKTFSKIPLSPNIKKKRSNKKEIKRADDVSPELKVEKTIVRNSISSIAALTNVVQEDDINDRLSEHKSKFNEEIHLHKKVNDAPPAGFKKEAQETPPPFFAWKLQTNPTAAPVKHFKTAPFALDDSNKKIVWSTEYADSYSCLPAAFYKSVVIHKAVDNQNNLIADSSASDIPPSPIKENPLNLDITRAGTPSSRITESIVIPSFFAWTPEMQLDRDEGDQGGKRMVMRQSTENVIIKSAEFSNMDSEYNRMYITPPAGFVARSTIVKRLPKSPIVLFTAFKPITEEEGEDKDFLANEHLRPSAPIPQFHADDEEVTNFITDKSQKEIVYNTDIETSNDLFIPIHKITDKELRSWVLIDSQPAAQWIAPPSMVKFKLNAKKHKIMNSRKKKVLGSAESALTFINVMTPQHFEVKKDKPNSCKNISEYDAQFQNPFKGSNFKKPVSTALKRKQRSFQ